MKKYLNLILVFVLIIAVIAGCNNAIFRPKDEVDDGFENRMDGIIYDDLSDRFTITVYPTKIITEDGNKNIVYSLTVINKSEEAYKNFYVTIAMNKKLDQYIAAGVYPLPLTKTDLAAKSNPKPAKYEGKGLNVEFQQLLSDEQFMYEAGLKYEDVVELGRNFELWLQWDGGEEKYELTSDVTDETP